MDHDCRNKPEEVEITKDYNRKWTLELYEENYRSFDDDGLIGFEKDYNYLGEVVITHCPFCGEELT